LPRASCSIACASLSAISFYPSCRQSEKPCGVNRRADLVGMSAAAVVGGIEVLQLIGAGSCPYLLYKANGYDRIESRRQPLAARSQGKESVKTPNRPFAPPRTLQRDLARALSFWEGLKRREAEIPFWDDVNLSVQPELSGRLMVIEASDEPVRFRVGFGLVGEEIKREYGGDLGGKFLDETEVRHPLQFLVSQCSATVESHQSTYYQHAEAGGGSSRAKHGYSRLVLPLWGGGRIGMLMVAFAWQ
jgi:hypothetical protein